MEIQNASGAQVADFLSSNSIKQTADNMPSLRQMSRILISGFAFAQTALGLLSPVRRQSGGGSAASCPDPQLSCHNSSAVENLCCFNSPGGSLLQTQFWDTDPVSGPVDSWTIHGLWPDNCDGTYEANCDDSRAYTNISAILQESSPDTLDYMKKYWTSNQGPAETFWEHEWGKHGTCISTLEPDCYTDYRPTEEVPDFFDRTVSLFKSLPSYQWLSDAGITPSTSKTYTSSEIQDALSSKHDGMDVYIGCNGNELDEIWYFFNVRGSLQSGSFVAADSLSSSSCPSSGIKYLPKPGGGGGGGSPSSSAPGSTPTGTPFSGKGYLNVITSGSKKGCIISRGTWYTTGTCATFTASSSGDGFTLHSSKGDCGISGGELTCGSGVSASTFSSDGGKLAYDGSSTFHADSVPSGTQQENVYTSGGGVSLTIQWQSK